MSDELEAARRELREALAVARDFAGPGAQPTDADRRLAVPADTDRDAEVPDDDA